MVESDSWTVPAGENLSHVLHVKVEEEMSDESDENEGSPLHFRLE